MRLEDFCTLDVICCATSTSVSDAARLMRDHHTGDLVVVDDPGGERTPLGIVTDRDIAIEVIARDLDPATTRVGTILRAPLVIANSGEGARDALDRMRAHGVRRLPVVGGGGTLVGIVTLDDLVQLAAEDLGAVAGIIAREQGRERRLRR